MPFVLNLNPRLISLVAGFISIRFSEDRYHRKIIPVITSSEALAVGNGRSFTCHMGTGVPIASGDLKEAMCDPMW